MVSDIQSIRGSQATPAVHESTQAAAAVASQNQPKVSLAVPKPADLNFDSGKLREDLQDAVKLLNEQMNVNKQGLGFSYDDTINRPVVTVRNTNTGEVVRQIPCEDMLSLAHKLEDLKGILFNNKV